MGKKKRSGSPSSKTAAAGAKGSHAYKNDVLRQQLSGLLDEKTLPTAEDVVAPQEPEVPAEPEPETDADLFSAAVADIQGSDALLEKYDVVAPSPAPSKGQPRGQARDDDERPAEAPEDAGDQRLFLDAVADVTPETFRAAKKAPRE